MIVLHRAWQEPGHEMDLFTAAGIFLEAEGDMEIDWTEGDVASIRDDLMKKSLSQVDDPRVGTTTLIDIAGWVENDDDRPFSFRDCVRPYSDRIGMALNDALDVVRSEFRAHLSRRLPDLSVAA